MKYWIYTRYFSKSRKFAFALYIKSNFSPYKPLQILLDLSCSELN